MKRKDNNKQENESMKAMTSLLQEYELALIPEKKELQERYQLSDLFYHTMEKIIQKQKQKALWQTWRRRCTAAAAGAGIIFAVTQQQMILKSGEWLVDWFQDHVSFQFAEETDINWVPRYEFGYVPEGFEKIADEYYENGGFLYYENQQGNRFDLVYGDLGAGLNVDNENKDILILKGSRGERIYFLRAQGPDDDSSMTWISEDGTTKFNMMGDLPEEELLKLQKNVRKTEEK